jgi:mRNA interferase MazF
MTFQRGDIVLVPFPFTDLTRAKARPAAIISSSEFNTTSPDIIVAAISSKVPAKLADTELLLLQTASGFKATGLRVDSVVRTTKLYTLMQSLVYSTLGKLNQQTLGTLDEHLARAVGLSSVGIEMAARRYLEQRITELSLRVADLEKRLAAGGKSLAS